MVTGRAGAVVAGAAGELVRDPAAPVRRGGCRGGPAASSRVRAARVRGGGRRRRPTTPPGLPSRPPRYRATSSSGRCVAESPIRCSGPSASASRRSIDRARWAPRLVGTSAWISSMIRVSRLRNASRAFEVSSRYSDSGVVMTMSAGSRRNRARSLVGVSPVRTRMVGTRTTSPRRAAAWLMPAMRRPQVALDVDGQRLERRHVEDPAAPLGRRLRLEHQPVQAPEEGGQRLAAAGRGQEQRRFAPRDRRPALGLGRASGRRRRRPRTSPAQLDEKAKAPPPHPTARHGPSTGPQLPRGPR